MSYSQVAMGCYDAIDRVRRRRGLEQISDHAALTEIIDQVLTAHPGQVAAYRAGKSALKGFFVGQVMKATSGRANPALLQQLLSERLDASA